ncbi:hypothetical protein IC232_28560 [Microvirga sp. BT688]|uniref:hypothetical protein n=1 Tax=Microvirga sp. TaxID=1873136 RepID=UPI0016890C2B|nr:hypothetical protein [Microvirga sp.]MBD2750607.1 hypothetical protein [Microvirga sp.]
MSDEINRYQNRVLETTSITSATADQLPATRIGVSSMRPIEINLVFIDVVTPPSTIDNGPYPTAVLMELSVLVRRVRATSPDSALAGIADAKIGKILARGGGDIKPGQGAYRCTK